MVRVRESEREREREFWRVLENESVRERVGERMRA